tara:strand:- start:21130 stop:22290 length:1161 start_codon:yes stop_codon:yes gene_type:complete
MGLLGTTTQESYYQQSQSKWSTAPNGTATAFTLTTSYFPTLTDLVKTEIRVFVNDVEIDTANYSFSQPTLTFTGRSGNESVLADGTGGTTTNAPINGATLVVRERSSAERHGKYQYVSMDNIINNFLFSYVGQDKIIPRANRSDVAFHAQRGLAELSYDTLRVEKSQEIEVPDSLTMILPHDYVNYVKLSWLETTTGIERILYPVRVTGNPKALLQDSDYNYLFDDTSGELLEGDPSETWKGFKSETTSEATDAKDTLKDLEAHNVGGRYGIDPQYAQANGTFFIDNVRGKIHFSSNLSNKIIVLRYVSDTLGTDGEMQIHKFAEEALYKWIIYGLVSTRSNIPEYIVNRYRKERFAATRKAKLRLSNLKAEELAQVMRGKSKWIK